MSPSKLALLAAALAATLARPSSARAQTAALPADGGATPQTTAAPSPSEPAAPFAFADFSWIPGGAGASERPLSWGPFVGELRVDTIYNQDFSRPVDDTISGSSEVFRSGEIQLTQLGIGGDFFYKNVQARLMTQFGLYSETTPRNDPSPGRGQWNLADAFRYISEAYGGYHINALNGINVQAGIFMSFIGLWSYYNFDNWTYQPSFVSSNTPWFFNGARIQIFTSDKLKIEPWLVNGWQSYGAFNQQPGVGGQVLWRPTGWFSLVSNNYFGADTLNTPGRKRVHTDNSAMVKYYDNPRGGLSKAAASLTIDLGCEQGGGVSCADGNASAPSQFFAGFMVYNRFWFDHDLFGFTVGGGAIDNPGLYLVLLPPINGATAISGVDSRYFNTSPGQAFKAWDSQLSFDYSPVGYITFRLEYNHRAASEPYFTGHGGVTPPGGNQGAPGSFVPGWKPDLTPTEDRISLAMMVKL